MNSVIPCSKMDECNWPACPQTCEERPSQMPKSKKISRRVFQITPAYDTAAKCWFVDEFPGVEAESLRELLNKLPKGTRLTNYYPAGAPPQSYGNAGDMVSADKHVVMRKIVKNPASWK